MKNRYFIVFYKCYSEQMYMYGNSAIKTDGLYISQKKLKKDISELTTNPFKENDICITNIIELTESDFNDYNN